MKYARAAIGAGLSLGNQGRTLFLQKGNYRITFDREITTKSGFIGMAKLEPRDNEEAMIPRSARLKHGSKIPIYEFHEMLGHQSVETTKQTAEHFGFKLTGKMEPCEACILAKARQKNVGKGDEGKRSKKPGERFFMDISSIKTTSYGGSKFWLLVVDDATDYCQSFFVKKKSDIDVIVVEMIKGFQSHNFDVKYIVCKYIHCDNAGENKRTEDLCKKEGLGVLFEYTAPGTPQHNGRVERKFATLYGRIRAMNNAAGLPKSMREGLSAKAAATATHLENLSVRQEGGPSSKAFGSFMVDLIWYLRTYGGMAVVTTASKIQGKLVNKGATVMLVGYAPSHARLFLSMHSCNNSSQHLPNGHSPHILGRQC